MRRAACRAAYGRRLVLFRSIALCAALCAFTALPAIAQESQELIVPLRVNGALRGTVPVTIDARDESLVDVGSELIVLISEFDTERVFRLIDLDEASTSSPGRLDAYQLEELGIDAVFDANKLELSIVLQPYARRIARHEASRVARVAEATLKEEAVGGGFNLKGTGNLLLLSRDETSSDASLALRGDAFLTAWKWVLESDASATADDEGWDFDMGDVVLTHDYPEAKLRLQAGTIKYPVIVNQRRLPVYGATLFSSTVFDPAYRADRYDISFFLDKESEVSVARNGKIVFKERLPAGPHIITDIPIQTGVNDIELRADGVELRYSVPFENNLLKKGSWLFGTALGLLESDLTMPMLAGYLKHGFTASVTGESFIHADPATQALGADAIFALKAGTIMGSLAASHSFSPENGHDLGAMGRFDYRSKDFFRPGLNFTAFLEGRTPWFISAGTMLSPNINALSAGLGLSGALPTLPIQLDGGLSTEIAYETSDTGLSFWGGMSARLGKRGVLNGTLRYSPLPQDAATKLRAELSFRYVLDGPVQEVGIRETFDRPETVLSVKGKPVALSTGDLNWSADLLSPVFPGLDDSADILGLNGLVQYQGTRIDARYAHAFDYNEYGAAGTEAINRMQIDLDTGFVFAGKGIAWTSPTARNFLIIRGAGAFKDIPVGIPSGNAWSVKSDIFGPVAISGFEPYRPRRVEVIPTEVPEGYLPDKAVETLIPGYRSAYLMSVGGAVTVQLIGRVENGKGKALEFVAGTLTQADAENPVELRFFTVEEGAFQVDGLLPGAWILSLSGNSPTRRIEIPAGATGQYDAGLVTLKEDQP